MRNLLSNKMYNTNMRFQTSPAGCRSNSSEGIWAKSFAKRSLSFTGEQGPLPAQNSPWDVYGIKGRVGARTLDYESGSLRSIPGLAPNLLRLSVWCRSSLTSRIFRQCCVGWAKQPRFRSISRYFPELFRCSSKRFRLGKQSPYALRGGALFVRRHICPVYKISGNFHLLTSPCVCCVLYCSIKSIWGRRRVGLSSPDGRKEG